MKKPAGYWLEWGRQFENLQAASKRLLIVVPAYFFLIFIMLFTALGSIILVRPGDRIAADGDIIESQSAVDEAQESKSPTERFIGKLSRY